MSRKTILLLTISLFFVTLIFNYRFLCKKQSLEIFNNKEEVKPKEKEKDKKKDKNKEKEKSKSEEKKKEITDIPWTYTWKGAICSLLICSLIATIIIIPAMFYFKKEIKNNMGKVVFFVFHLFLYLIPLEIFVSPFVLALKKFGKRNYWQRLPKTYSKCKKIIDSFIFIIILTLFFLLYKFLLDDKKKEKTNFLKFLLGQLKNVYLFKGIRDIRRREQREKEEERERKEKEEEEEREKREEITPY